MHRFAALLLRARGLLVHSALSDRLRPRTSCRNGNYRMAGNVYLALFNRVAFRDTSYRSTLR